MVVHNFKMVIVGDSGVGKTSLLTRYVKDEFRATGTRSTISAAFLERRVVLDDGDSVRLELWDTAGQERFRSLNTPMYYRGAAGALICYDATDAKSWEHVPGWYSQLRMMGEKDVIVGLCGSKLDLSETRRQVATAAASTFAETNRIAVFRETSSKTGANVDDVFRKLAEAMVAKARAAPRQDRPANTGQVKLVMPPPNPDRRSTSSVEKCCA